GVSGIALFLAAHAVVTGRWSSAELGLAGVSYLRKNLKSRNAARMARSLGIGAATGLGSIVYSLAVISRLLNDDDLLSDAHVAARLFTDDLIAADRQLDVIGGSAGAVLGLLRLYRDGASARVLARAEKCGEHLLVQPRIGPEGRRTWNGQGSGPGPLHATAAGAAGGGVGPRFAGRRYRPRGFRARGVGVHRLRECELRCAAAELAGPARRGADLAVAMVSRRVRHRACAHRDDEAGGAGCQAPRRRHPQ